MNFKVCVSMIAFGMVLIVGCETSSESSGDNEPVVEDAVAQELPQQETVDVWSWNGTEAAKSTMSKADFDDLRYVDASKGKYRDESTGKTFYTSKDACTNDNLIAAVVNPDIDGDGLLNENDACNNGNAPASLVSYWGFEGGSNANVAVDSYDGNDGVITGAARVTGKIGDGLSFDGVNDGVLASANGLTVGAGIGNTYEFWVSFTNVIVDSRMFDVRGGFSSEISVMVVAGGTIRLVEADDPSGWGTVVGPTATPLNDGAWHMISCVRETSGLWRVYVDGVEAANGATARTPVVFTMVAIGNRFDGTSPFGGTIDEVAMYNSAMTPAEVAARYNGGAGSRY